MSALPPAAIRCHYANNPDLRPDCRITASARIGPIPLCPSCLQRRSTLGKGQPVRPLPAGQPAVGFDPLAWLTQAHTELRTAEHRLRKECAELAMERDVLKRSVALWVREAMGR